MIIPLILAGGAGKRLSTLTTETKAKPFLEMLGMSTLFEQTLKRVEALGYGKPWVSINETQLPNLSAEVKDRLEVIICEGSQRDTMAAVTFACYEARMKEQGNTIVVIPADQIYENDEDFTRTVKELVATTDGKGFGLIGSRPTSPRTTMGYITANGDKVQSFIEKPLLYTAMKMFRDSSVFWNSGVLVCDIRSFIGYGDVFDRTGDNRNAILNSWNHAKREGKLVMPDKEYYAAAEAQSYDNALIAKFREDSGMLSFAELKSRWFDLGTLQGLIDYIESDLGKSHQVEKPWGWYSVITEEPKQKIKILCIKPGKSISLQSHKYRSEKWTIVSGRCEAKINGKWIEFVKDESGYIDKGILHQAINHSKQPVFILEVQQGEIVDEDDITRIIEK